MVPNTLIDAVVFYTNLGWGIVPLQAGTKVPCIKRWTTHPFTDPLAVEEFWRKNPAASIGIVAGFSGLVCVDCDGPEGLAAFLALLEQHGGELGEPIVADTPSGGRHYVYKHPGCRVPSRGQRHALPIDVKADGGQFVVEPSAKPDGRQYKWIEWGVPGEMPEWLKEWVVADDTEEERKKKAKKAKPRAYAAPLPAGDKLTTFLSRLENLQKRGDNAWQACCPAHDSVGKKSLSVCVGDTQPVVVHCFAGCEPESIFGAVGLGYSDVCVEMERETILDGLTEFCERFAEESPLPQGVADDPGGVPSAVMDGLGGIIGAVFEWNRRTALSWQPELALAGAIALVATITGRKVEDERNTRTNVYLVGVAPAGSGKEHARKLNRVALDSTGATDFLAPSDLASGAGLATLLSEHPTRLAQIDEIGDLLASIRAGGAKSRHLATIETYLKEIYSSADSTWVTGGYADTAKNKSIRFPHLVLYGTGSPDKFWESITPSNIGDGVLPRLMIFSGNYVRNNSHAERIAGCPTEIAKAVQAWTQWQPTPGNLGAEFCSPVMVPIDSAAQRRLKAHGNEIAERRVREDSIRAAVWSRTAEKSGKLALIFACSRILDPSTGGLMVTLDDVERAIALSNWLTRRMIFQVWGKVGRNDRERNAKRILELVGDDELTWNELTRKTQWMTKRDRKELVDELEELGELVIFTTASQATTGGRPRKVVKRRPSFIKSEP